MSSPRVLFTGVLVQFNPYVIGVVSFLKVSIANECIQRNILKRIFSNQDKRLSKGK